MPSLRTIPKLGKAGPKSPAGVVAKAPPPTKTQGRPLPDLAQPTMAPRGAALLHLGQKAPSGTGGPGTSPPTWEGPETEWVWHWCSRKYFFQQEHLDPYQTPWGGLSWQYQAPETPNNPREAGGSVSDFVYLLGATNVIVRIEGFYDHVQRGGAAQQARDLYLVAHAGAEGDRVVRVQDGEFMEDVTGNTGIRLLADILANRPRLGQLAGGVVEPPRYANFETGVGV
jgi:hypothetical protein